MALLLSLTFASQGIAQRTKAMETPIPYQFFDANGKPATWQQVMRAASEADFICFGELHNQSMAHWLQLQMAKALYTSKKDKLTLAYEMLEADVQADFDRFAAAVAKDEKQDPEQVKKLRLWPNHETDYQPLVAWAAKLGLQQIASNCPRPLARLVSKQGLDTLNGLGQQEKSWLCPLPLAVDTSLPGYAAMVGMMGSGHGMPNFNPWNFVYAQAIKDATMAYRSLALAKAGSTILHLNGSYHSDNFEGIVHYLPIMAKVLNKPVPRVVTISTVLAAEMPSRYSPEANKAASFYLVLPQDAPTSY